MRTIKYLLQLFILAVLISCKPTADQSKEYNWALLPFTKADDANPVLLPDTTSTFLCPVRNTIVQWEEKDVFNPAAVVRNDTVFLLFRAEDSIGKYAGTSRIGIAWSTDGLHFTKHPIPVLYPDNDASKIYEWEGGCEDPRVVEDENGTYFMTYTAYDGDKARLLIASSKDLYHWTKHGHAFKNDTAEVNKWSKSGSIDCKYENGKATAAKIDGKYCMYWGDTDSDLVEPGPPAMLTERGIVLIYNSRNVPSKGDTNLAEGTYAASQILFDKNNPTKVIDRMDTYFMKPDKPYEITGQVNHVCFVEGLVNYKGKWFLYYGTADSKIAVAVRQ